jgi:hypothetical protein
MASNSNKSRKEQARRRPKQATTAEIMITKSEKKGAANG